MRGLNAEEEEQDDGQDMGGIFNRIDGNLDNLQTRFAQNMESGNSTPKGSVLDDEHFKESSELMRQKSDLQDITLQSFRIKSTLGRGAFGRVYLAELPENGKHYAIKAIRKDVLLDTQQV